MSLLSEADHSLTDYTVVVRRCELLPSHFRWKVLRRGVPLDLDGYAYASRWMAEQAGAVALKCEFDRRRIQMTADHTRF
jgi:hypothetical protein